MPSLLRQIYASGSLSVGRLGRIYIACIARRSATQAAGYAVTNARFASLHGLPVAPSPLADPRPKLVNQHQNG
ncbi:MAG TPA: hypothetical protein VGO67_21395 [Verrucomicrobiae bacterium]